MPNEVSRRQAAPLKHRTKGFELVDFVSKDGDDRLVALEDILPDQERNFARLIVDEVRLRDG
jgi:hypothetical protein